MTGRSAAQGRFPESPMARLGRRGGVRPRRRSGPEIFRPERSGGPSVLSLNLGQPELARAARASSGKGRGQLVGYSTVSRPGIQPKYGFR